RKAWRRPWTTSASADRRRPPEPPKATRIPPPSWPSACSRDNDEMTDDQGGDAFHRRLHRIAPTQLRSDTAQTSGMRRVEAISGTSVGSRNLWMGQTHVPAVTNSGNHHHGHSETAIYVVSGHPAFVFLDETTGEE